MKKAGIIITSFFFLLMPYLEAEAQDFQSVPPNIIIEGINKKEYDINKEISEEKVVVTLKEKTSNLVYSWTFNRNELQSQIYLNFKLSLNSPRQIEIDEKSLENNDKMYLSFSHHGDLPAKATIKVDVQGKYKNGENLYLYYYNEESENIEYMAHNIKVENGYVEFDIEHCSEYFLTGAVVNDVTNNPKSMNIVIVVLVGVIVLLVGATLFSTKK